MACMLFIDFRKAFDLVVRDRQLEVLYQFSFVSESQLKFYCFFLSKHWSYLTKNCDSVKQKML